MGHVSALSYQNEKALCFSRPLQNVYTCCKATYIILLTQNMASLDAKLVDPKYWVSSTVKAFGQTHYARKRFLKRKNETSTCWSWKVKLLLPIPKHCLTLQHLDQPSLNFLQVMHYHYGIRSPHHSLWKPQGKLCLGTDWEVYSLILCIE